MSSSGSRNRSRSNNSKSPHERVFINRSKPVGAGLLNLGNTCFLNSVLQALSHCDFLINAIDSSHHSEHCTGSADGCVLCAFERHIRIARNMTDPIAPEQIVQCLPTISSTLTLGEQEDAHEFLRCMVDALQRSIPPEIKKRKEEYPFSLFNGSVKNIVRCMKCKKVSTRVDPVEDLELEITKARNLQAALTNFTSNEMMTGENKYYCESCCTKTEAQRSLSLHEIPPVLSIQLKRFTYNGRKLRHFVEYPLSIDFSRYMSFHGKSSKGSRSSNVSSKASLFAIVVHHGYSISNGHYVCYINTSHGWFKMDDASVKTCTEEEAMKQNAYLLFYQKHDKSNKFYRSDAITEIAVHIARTASPVGGSPVEPSTGASSGAAKMNAPLSKRNRSSSDLFDRSAISAMENNANLVNKGVTSSSKDDEEAGGGAPKATGAKKVTIVAKRKLSSVDGSNSSKKSKSIIQKVGKVLSKDSLKQCKVSRQKENIKRVTIRALKRDNEQSETDANNGSDNSRLDENDNSNNSHDNDCNNVNSNDSEKERVEWIPWIRMRRGRSRSSSNVDAPSMPQKPKRGVFGWVNHWLGRDS